MGRINKIRSTPLLFILLRAKTYASGYAIIKHAAVVTIAKPKLINSTLKLEFLPKKSIKFSNVIETFVPDKVNAPLGSSFVNA